MASRRKLLWLGQADVPPNIRDAAEGRWDFVPCRRDESLASQLRTTGLAVACLNGEADDPRELARLLDAVDHAPAIAIVLLPDHLHDGVAH